MLSKGWIVAVALLAVVTALVVAGVSADEPASAVETVSASAPSLPASSTPPAEPAAEREVLVRVYSVADLVSPIHAAGSLGARTSLAGWPSGLQEHVAANLAALQNLIAAVLPPDSGRASRLGLTIVSYPEKHCLVVRDTPAGHRAIEDLLQQLRTIRSDDQIDLQLELVNEKLLADLQTRWGLRPLDAEERAIWKAATKEELVGSTLRLANGQTRMAGGPIVGAFWPRITALLSSDRTHVEIRLDHLHDDQNDETYSWGTVHETIPVNRTSCVVMNVIGEGTMYLLITPTIVPRQAK